MFSGLALWGFLLFLCASPGRAFELWSPDFPSGGEIPRRHTCDGEDLSPALRWKDVPAGTKSLALVVEDPDAPRGVWVHWLLYDLDPELSGLEQGVSRDASLESGAKQGKNDFGRLGYGGPCPPPGDRPHRYVFRLYALDAPLGLPPGASKEEVRSAAERHARASAEYTGRYARPRAPTSP
ncbi:MAG: hypothetical protein KatS3mg076_0776 [Candidatus Binatia bacterium]|nr:MAG: hypothetical protein KatS3mg076_0776 [Candidatus Binatia bacterium]